MGIYVDHSSTTPVDPRVLEAMLPFYQEQFFNPSALYPEGRRVQAALGQSRQTIADYLNCSPEEIIFTSGGTESDNLAVLGVMERLGKKKFITSKIEHHAILSATDYLEQKGFSVVVLPVDEYGFVSPAELEKNIDDDTALVSIMWANNETGAIQPIEELCEIAHKHGALFHTDAVQAIGTQEIDLSKTKVDLLSFSSHKIYGPKGAGVLFFRKGVELVPRNMGGQQEGFLRGGTENVACIVGMAKAIELLKQEREGRCAKLSDLSDDLLVWVEKLLQDVKINTPKVNRIPGVINMSFKGVEAEPMMILLGAAGICASMGAACNSSSVEPSHVLKAMQVPADYIRGSLRISFGKDSTAEMPEQIATELDKILKRIRK
ncbi:MAG: cysteine desulfurase [Oscillospiraceae bacterium]|nr:cysteine desulfurase [Oscillospiraceae bacterium]